MLSAQEGQLTNTKQAISEQRLPAISLLDGSPNVRKSSFSALLRQRLRIPGLGMMGDGGEPHTCQMICHYRGVSTQLSPPNHPSFPLKSPPPTKPNSTLVLQKHPLHSSGSSSFTRSAATPSAPPSYTLPREKMYPCERHSTLSALCGCGNVCLCPRVCVYTIHECEYMFI